MLFSRRRLTTYLPRHYATAIDELLRRFDATMRRRFTVVAYAETAYAAIYTFMLSLFHSYLRLLHGTHATGYDYD